VSCSQTSVCVAVGGYNGPGGVQKTFSETWNGRTWTAPVKATYRRGTNGEYLTGITCFFALRCVAAGNTQTVNGVYTTLVDRWNGSAWATVRSPAVPAGAFYFRVNSSSCASSTVCAAVGGYTSAALGGGLNTAFIMQTTG
jgi:hypothetical protein